MCLCFLSPLASLSQSYFANGDAQVIGGSCYQITPPQEFKLGSVWYADQLDISKDFDLEFYLNFGDRDQNGADGMYFVLQTAGNRAIGMAGGGMGFEGFSPSLGIEFDTWNNGDLGDISQDHIAININGNANHSGPNSIVGPTPATSSGDNIEDGEDHLVRIVWEQIPKILSVYFDCELRISTRINMQFDVFQTQNLVYWGFTGATGGSVNTQIACLRDDIIISDTVDLCEGDTVLLSAKESEDNTYVWSPSDGLDDPTVRTPQCFTKVAMDYEVRYLDLCGNLLIDTVHVGIDEPFTIDEGQDTLLCDDETYYLDISNKYDSIQWGGIGWGSADRVEWENSGVHTLRVWKGVCYDDDEFEITRSVSPEIVISEDSLFCDGDSIDVNVSVTPANALWKWQDDETSDTSRFFTASINGFFEAQNTCDSVRRNFSLIQIEMEDFSLGRDTMLCEDDSLLIIPNLQDDYTYLWSDGSTDTSLLVTEDGTYRLEISKLDFCFKSNSITVNPIFLPTLGVYEDIVLCENETIVVRVDSEYGTVIWNNTIIEDSLILKNYEGEVSVRYFNACAADSTSFDVELRICNCDLVFPNAFTPNDDQLNGLFQPIIDCPKLVSFNQGIYNRWGEKIFESQDLSTPWDGKVNGKVVQDGLYFHITAWRGIENGEIVRKTTKGNIYLLR